MKRENLSRLLSLMLVLVLSVSLLAGCSSEEVPYSASAEEYDDVYVTLVSIEPMVKVGTGEKACNRHIAAEKFVFDFMNIYFNFITVFFRTIDDFAFVKFIS